MNHRAGGGLGVALFGVRKELKDVDVNGPRLAEDLGELCLAVFLFVLPIIADWRWSEALLAMEAIGRTVLADGERELLGGRKTRHDEMWIDLEIVVRVEE